MNTSEFSAWHIADCEVVPPWADHAVPPGLHRARMLATFGHRIQNRGHLPADAVPDYRASAVLVLMYPTFRRWRVVLISRSETFDEATI
jgi:hypothetical protein